MNEQLEKILLTEPTYRRKQIYAAWFDKKTKGYNEITTLPIGLKEKLKKSSWLTVESIDWQESKDDSTVKVLLKLEDGNTVESVLMGRINKKENREAETRNTICISTQVGCPMGCVFCATGVMGFKRNLTAREIIDQYRFWQDYLIEKKQGEIDNVVLMGQGEPLLNYDNVKDALNTLLTYTNLGPRQITLSTVGVKNGMEQMLTDKDFPPVRFALSLHSAIAETRLQMIPSHPPDFFTWLPNWADDFHKKFPGRSHFIGLEYTLVQGKNDDNKHLKALIKLASKLGRVRINLIPCNPANPELSGTEKNILESWQQKLMESGFTCTIRRSQGQDIAAACGQLANKNIKSK